MPAWVELALYGAACFLVTDTPPPIPTATEVASEVASLLEAGELERLHGQLLVHSPWRRKELTELQRKTAFMADYGRVLDVVAVEATPREGTFRVRMEHGELEMRIAITEKGTLTQFHVDEFEPLVRSRPLALPFTGEWEVIEGGETKSINRHATERSGRRALDFTIMDRSGSLYRGEGLENSDYYAYGQPIRAMESGKVMMVVDGVPDNGYEEKSTSYWLGNLIVIQHDEQLVSVYGHLSPGTMQVRPGDPVERGQILGKCGNSGHSSMPHLHVQVQDGVDLDEAWGVEPLFADLVVERDGERRRMMDVALVKGDRVGGPL